MPSRSRYTSKYAWLNGALVEWDAAQVHSSAHGLHYGTGVFEGVRSYRTENGPALFRLDDHLRRLSRSAGAYAMEIPFTHEELVDATRQAVSSNGLSDAYIRHLSFFDQGELGIRSTCSVSVVILAWAWTGHHGKEGLENGIRATISPWRKIGTDMLPTTAKAAGQYLNSRLAVSEAASRGFAEAILLNPQGNVAEASVANVFIVQDDVLITNDSNASILMGITRDSAIQIAKDLGIPVAIRDFGPEELLSATEVFITGTASEIVPIREIDGMVIGQGMHPGRGEITARIQEEFFAATRGKSRRYDDWLSYLDVKEPIVSGV